MKNKSQRRLIMNPERKHSVRIKSLGTLELSKAGSAIELEIYREGEKLGTVELGHGSLGWRGAKKKSFKRITWTEYARMMDEM
jgi:hypothetical protein